jgi:pimeloyl-ACP methyl ester carboxylesterase
MRVFATGLVAGAIIGLGGLSAPLAAKLAPRYTVIVPDLRGMGLSARPAGGYDKKTQALATTWLGAAAEAGVQVFEPRTAGMTSHHGRRSVLIGTPEPRIPLVRQPSPTLAQSSEGARP